MLQQLVKHGLLEDALTEMRPFVDRVCGDKDFHEWYDASMGKAEGSMKFHGSAGELGTAIKMLHEALNHTLLE